MVVVCHNRGGRGYLGLCYITHFASDSASIFHQFMGMTVPKRRGNEKIIHAHMLLTCSIYLNSYCDCDRSCPSISGSVIVLGGGVVSICYIGPNIGVG